MYGIRKKSLAYQQYLFIFMCLSIGLNRLVIDWFKQVTTKI